MEIWIVLALGGLCAWWAWKRRVIVVSFRDSASSDELRGYRNRFDRRMEELLRRAEERERTAAQTERLAAARKDMAPENYRPNPRELPFGNISPLSAFGSAERESIASAIIHYCQGRGGWVAIPLAELRRELIHRHRRHINYENIVDWDIRDFLDSGRIFLGEDGRTVRVTRSFIDRCAESYRKYPPQKTA